MILGVMFVLASALYFAFLALFREFNGHDVEVVSGLLRRLNVPGGAIALSEGIMGAPKNGQA